MSVTKAQLIDGKVATVEFSGGSASLPSVTFTGDTSTGVYSPGTGQVAISTNGTGRFYIDASGNVGLGVTPSGKFHIGGVSSAIVFNKNGSGTDNALLYDNSAASPTP